MRSMASVTDGTRRAVLALVALVALGGCMAGVGDELDGEFAEDEELGTTEEALGATPLPCWASFPEEATASVGSPARFAFWPWTRLSSYPTRAGARDAACPSRGMIINGEGWSDRNIRIRITDPYRSDTTQIEWTIYGHGWDGTTVTRLDGGIHNSVERTYRVWEYARFEVVATAITSFSRRVPELPRPLTLFRRDPVDVEAYFP